jgi:hypothetical protein
LEEEYDGDGYSAKMSGIFLLYYRKYYIKIISEIIKNFKSK